MITRSSFESAVSIKPSAEVRKFYKAAPGGVPTQTAFSQDRRWDDLDIDREAGVFYFNRSACAAHWG